MIKEKENLEKIFQYSNDAIFLINPLQDKILEVNPRACKMLGFSHEELLTMSVSDIHPTEMPKLMAFAHTVAEEGSGWTNELSCRTQNGENLSAEISAAVVRINTENCLICMVRDITERKNLEAQRDELVNSIAHDIRNPLTAMIGGISTVLEGKFGKVNEVQKRMMSISLSSMQRLQNMTNDLLDIARLEAGQVNINRELVDIVSLVKEVCSFFYQLAKDKGIQILERYPEHNIKGYMDKEYIFRIFTNLVNNAIKFTDQGNIEISVVDQKDSIVCHVSDTGKGISEEDLTHVFERFHQLGSRTNNGKEGVGLGLSICKKIVELHHGKIWVNSKLNKGTRFVFSLPKNATP